MVIYKKSHIGLDDIEIVFLSQFFVWLSLWHHLIIEQL